MAPLDGRVWFERKRWDPHYSRIALLPNDSGSWPRDRLRVAIQSFLAQLIRNELDSASRYSPACIVEHTRYQQVYWYIRLSPFP